MEYGESHKVYWNSAKSLKQIEAASQLAELKYHSIDDYKLVLIFNHCSCHTAVD